MSNYKGILTEALPRLEYPVFIAGFSGWGNVLDVSMGMADYLVRKLNAEYFAKIDPDTFYRYDETRPVVNVEKGTLKSILPPGGSFYAARTRPNANDIVILRANEPNIRWFRFTDELFSFCEKLGIETIITLGSMYDNVLHSDRIISGIVSDQELFSTLKNKNVAPISYQGPSAIHAIIQSAGQERGFRCVSLWCHCPYYLEGITHYGLLADLGTLLASLINFDLDTTELEENWKELNKKIEALAEENPNLQDVIQEIRREKVEGARASLRQSIKSGEKVINLSDFLELK
ncbi:PAC2 family protein [Desulfococcaceae bacterium HSG8]|nr:PAC2 family protein [Desulfococcaceae bacterium HSG8]